QAGSAATGPDNSNLARPQLRIGTTPAAIRVDGKLDEPIWNAADSITNLVQVEPVEGAIPFARTVVRVLTTDGAIIIGVRADDPDRKRTVTFAGERAPRLDNEDHIKIVLDTYLDGRSGYVFAVNANGARYDALVANHGEGENPDWDAVW